MNLICSWFRESSTKSNDVLANAIKVIFQEHLSHDSFTDHIVMELHFNSLFYLDQICTECSVRQRYA
jgi:hypothetical protein